MRRSAAPSVCSRPFKKSKFCTPFSSPSANEKASSPPTTGVQKLSDQEPCQNKEEQKNEGKSSKDAAELSSSLVNKENRFFAKKTFKNPSSIYSSSTNGLEELKAGKPAAGCESPVSKYFNVVWCKASKKKHKKWDGDGILVVSGRQVVLKDEEGKDIGKTSSYKSSELAALKEGETLFVGGKEIEVMSTLSAEEYTSGRCFNQGLSQPTPAPSVNDRIKSVNSPNVSASFSIPKKRLNGDDNNHLSSSFKRKQVVDKPRHNPNAPGAIVMPRPSASHQWLHNKQGLPVVDVVIDPFIASHLRSHQVEGVIFLYRCIMGMGNFNGNGAILADEMGLGKTLQCIALIWTLLKQAPYGGKSKFKRILIVTPGSLVKNWRAEFQKWLGNERLKTFAVGSDKTVEEFSRCIVYPVMIVSYEMLLRNLDDVKKIGFNLIVCDEGHRLKNFSIKTSAAISGLGISSMVLLTGTPIQNDLTEFYSLGDLCNPRIFGTASSFRRNFGAPIIRSQEPSCSAGEKSLGADRAAELKRLTNLFVLRRTSELNQAYLPPKAEFVVFCPLSTLQRTLYDKILNSRAVSMCISAFDRGSGHLVCISALKKLCNHPRLLFPAVQEIENLKLQNIEDDQRMLYDGLLQLYPKDFECISPAENCGKLFVLEKLIGEFQRTREKCVVVSNSTKTLDILESVLRTKNLRCLRLDGKTLTSDRQRLVDQFNSNSSGIDVFLLSSKAGGTGLNLVGASRLILYDIDWNPANDMQAMARVWRDGQKRKVYIYRLLSAGTIEEKMYQRQISKQGLSGHIVDLKTNKVEFSTEDLKDLFKLNEPDLCSTHDLLGCRCHVTGEQEITLPESHARLDLPGKQHSKTKDKKILSMAELMSWNHILPTDPEKLVDDALKRCLEHVKFVFQNQSNTP